MHLFRCIQVRKIQIECPILLELQLNEKREYEPQSDSWSVKLIELFTYEKCDIAFSQNLELSLI